MLRKPIIAVVFITILSSVAVAQEPALRSVSYQLSMSRPTSHLFEVQIIVEVPEELKDKPLQFQMPKWSPGRYAVFDFAKNVQEFRANGAVKRIDDQTWSVAPQGKSTINVS
jgi:predicted metalloprotease with PDZ domain